MGSCINAQLIHASAFAYDGMGCLLTGPSGSGKSRLLAGAMLHQAQLISDDQVALHAYNGHLVACPAPHLSGIIELRGLGLIKHPQTVASHPIHLVVDLGEEDERLPEPATMDYCGIDVPFRRLASARTMLAAPLLLYLKAMREGRILPTDWHPLG